LQNYLKIIIVAYFLLINLISYFMVWYDKRQAKLDRWRIPEKRLFKLAFAGGAIGVYLGMKRFRHKTKHGSFIYGIPLIALLNIIAVYYLLVYLVD